MRAFAVIALIAGCTKATPDPPPPSPSPPGPITPRLDAGVIDAAPRDAHDAPDAQISNEPIAITPLPMAGPYKSLDDSCAAARPCGETGDIDGVVTPAKTPDCSAMDDPARNPINHVPSSIDPRPGAVPKLSSLVGKAQDEVRIAPVMCGVPKRGRGEPTEHYVFIHRKDGWWRTSQPLMSWTYNDKYCGGGIYVNWNTNDARTILGIAAGQYCTACNWQMTTEDIIELMVRVETTGTTPRVFQPLVVGARTTTSKAEGFAGATGDGSVSDCKLGASATSLTEKWVSADEVILSGGNGTGGPLAKMITIVFDATPLTAPGRYRFTR